ncbi:hypothetical protein [Amycolatopsis alkalitolerans]|uniref:Uncharacterized protein n=1 Tax=Amycolatopsis alkalitolerans TaxID=2547244 RepID=A0A5C4LTM8_9PSEU|nr:hypothetical protein [Amycolatopsis alkalitolerans]TNC22123.1 hypothetical protein FG385_26615 [Amycolatopsis alkalitolerans]
MDPTKLGIGLVAGAVVVSASVVGIALAIRNGDSASSPCADKAQSVPCFNAAGQWVGAGGSVSTPPTTYRYSAPPTTSTYSPPPIRKDDFTVELKVTSKQCFGTAGCNVVVEPMLNYKYGADRMTSYGTCDVTYSISGDESGEVIGTAYGDGGTRFRVSNSILSTNSSRVQPKATVTDVTCR